MGIFASRDDDANSLLIDRYQVTSEKWCDYKQPAACPFETVRAIAGNGSSSAITAGGILLGQRPVCNRQRS